MELTRTPDVPVPPRTFVPADFDPTDLEALAALVRELLERPLRHGDDLREWIEAWGELMLIVGGEFSRARIASDVDTRVEAFRERRGYFQREVMPAVRRHGDKLNRAFLASPHRDDLPAEFDLLVRLKTRDAELFREENVALGARAMELASEWREIQGRAEIELDGETLTMPQAALHLRSRDRDLRERVYTKITRRRAEDAERIDAIYDEMVALRHEIARNADHDDFRAYKFAELHRDYTPADCEGFHDAVEHVVLPLVRDLEETRRRVLGVDVLRPWDLAVDLFGGGADRLFEGQDELIEMGRRTFQRIDAGFAEEFEILVRNGLLDLMSRPGKAPGGYQSMIGDMRLPFIFMNGVGTPRNYETLLHEGGHAFHALACRDIKVPIYWKAPTEFCEVAAMAMELFAFDHIHEIVGEERARAIRYGKLERLIDGFASVAQIDAFQHWIYTNPACSVSDRRAKWAELHGRFGPDVDPGPVADLVDIRWHPIPHLFNYPFYYIEYGIAQLGALQLWDLKRSSHDAAIAGYRSALALGGTRPLPQLFQEAGIRFAMDRGVFEDILIPLAGTLAMFSPDAC